MTQIPPKVSVCVVTYNQNRYIRRCLQSIVDQETDFDFEVIVADDCSTDGTRVIVQEFADRYPKLVRPMLHSENQGPFKNYRSVHRAASGDYVAHIDADDCAYRGKLVKQSEYLDRHENCVLVAHRMSVWNGCRQVGCTPRNPTTITLPRLLSGHPMFLNSSIMYRREKLGDVFHSEFDFIDFYVYVKAGLQGEIGFINEILGQYTENVGISCRRHLMPSIQAALDLTIDVVPSEVLGAARSRQYLSYSVAALMAGDSAQFVSYLKSARMCNEKNVLVFVLQKMGDYTQLTRFFVSVYKTSRILGFRLKTFLVGWTVE